jgi:predicted lipase
MNRFIIDKLLPDVTVLENSTAVFDNSTEVKKIFKNRKNTELLCATMCSLAYNWFMQEEIVSNCGLNKDDFNVYIMNDRDLIFSTYFFDGNLIVAFKGSSTLKDHMSNVNMTRTSHLEGKVHRGFYELLTKNDAHLKIAEIIQEYKANSVYLTGHSLGGALATLLYSFNFDINFTLITFGSPRVGDHQFAKRIRNSIRYVYGDDIVTKLPLPFRFRHVSAEKKLEKVAYCNVDTWSIEDHSISKYIQALRN